MNSFVGIGKAGRQHVLIYILETWHIFLDRSGFGGAILMDLLKAFDIINYELLTAKLYAYGFDKNALKLRFLKDENKIIF